MEKHGLVSFKEAVCCIIISMLVIFFVFFVAIYPAIKYDQMTVYIGELIDTQVIQKEDSIENEFWITFELQSGDIQKFKMKNNYSKTFFELIIGRKYEIRVYIENNALVVHEITLSFP